ncbi:glycosyltransferase family 4 protein [Candidatus Hecatella orcuttiae]|jgi:glycosyltransferase involved in cell wall biosynthesis|uniref:glycosyltransferase family 4 protein n=1 Tax=Candidatus Hecatella orcuttiae TaxID=1935119 RepID=UPI002867F607|nr:glycosyltransferase family 4 protein [Candidatus Hecatella orcuttiae]
MRILLVSQYYLPYVSGITTYIERLARGLSQRGHRLTLVTSQHTKGLRRLETGNSLTVHRVPVLFKFQRGAFAPRLLWEALKHMRSSDAVNLHVPLFESGLLGVMAKLCGKRLYLTYHSDLARGKGPLFWVVEKLYYLSLKLACFLSDGIVVNSLGHMKTSKVKNYARKCVQITPPVDVERFRRIADTEDFRKKNGIEPGEKIIGNLGRFAPEKGLEYLIKALPLILREIPEAKVVLAGIGEKMVGGEKESVKPQLEALIENLGMAGRVKFLGFLDHESLLKFYSTCDVFVFPSISVDTFGLVQAEALLCGTPVVATDLPGPRDAVALTGGGLLAKPGDEVSLAQAVVAVLKHPAKFTVSRNRLLEFFGVEKTAAEYEKLFQKLA